MIARRCTIPRSAFTDWEQSVKGDTYYCLGCFLCSTGKGCGAAVWVRRLVQEFPGRICYKNNHSRAGSCRWPLAVAAARLWVMSLEKKDKRKHFGLFVTSSAGPVEKQNYQHLSQNMTNQQNYCVSSEAYLDLPVQPLSLISLRCPCEETGGSKIPIEHMKGKLWSDWLDSPGWSENSLGSLLFLLAYIIIVP